MLTNDPTDIWEWTYADSQRLREGGGALASLYSNYREFFAIYKSDFSAADQAISAAIADAHAAGEARWELHTRHWRLQLWLRDDLSRVLPEAVDLLTMATDERLRDVPQRICAIQDLVSCYVQMDAVGYLEEVADHSLQTLAQLPTKHSCADCARSHLAEVMAAAGRTAEAEQWLAQRVAHNDSINDALQIIARAEVYELLGQWENAARDFGTAVEKARKADDRDPYLIAQMGLARARAAQGDLPGASEALRAARHATKYAGNTQQLARLLEVEGYVAEANKNPEAALDYFTRAAQHYLGLARYRVAALTALHGADLAGTAQLDAAGILAVAAQAVGHMPPASQDVVARLAGFGRTPVPPESPSSGASDAAPAQRGEPDGERLALEATLQAYCGSGNARGVALALYRLGRWQMDHDGARAAVDYFILNAIVERIMQLGMSDREDALHALAELENRLPAGTVSAALTATESGPPPWLAALLGDIPPQRWAWLVRAVASELHAGGAVEPEPQEADENFGKWVDNVASMTALIIRQSEHIDPIQREDWAAAIDETVQEVQGQAGDDPKAASLLAFMRALADLARGVPPADIQIDAPFNNVIAQIDEVAQRPVWQHPGLAPLEFLVEDVAQRAVRALRQHDAHRASRLRHLAFRYQLIMLDLQTKEQLAAITAFVASLMQLVNADGQTLPTAEPPLEKPFSTILAAVFEAGQQPEAEAVPVASSPGETAQP